MSPAVCSQEPLINDCNGWSDSRCYILSTPPPVPLLLRKTAMTDWLRSASIKNRRPKHSMSHCQVPSCLALGLSWSLCVKSLCFCWYRSVCLLVVAVVETGRCCLWACGGVCLRLSLCASLLSRKVGKSDGKGGFGPAVQDQKCYFAFFYWLNLVSKMPSNAPFINLIQVNEKAFNDIFFLQNQNKFCFRYLRKKCGLKEIKVHWTGKVSFILSYRHKY